MPATVHTEPYTALADVYQAAGFAEYSRNMAPHLLNLAFELEWTGRVVLDLACGTGDLAGWFASRSYRVIGLDSSQLMLKKGVEWAKTHGVSIDFHAGDMRTFQPEIKFELVLCMGSSINYMATLREMETVFRVVHGALEPGKLFMFDMRTIQGLALAGSGDRVVSDDPEAHLIISRNSFNYESLTLTTQYTILRYSGTVAWQRAEETHTLRGYPISAVTRVLNSAGFTLLRTLTTDFEPTENKHNVEQVILVAQRGQ